MSIDEIPIKEFNYIWKCMEEGLDYNPQCPCKACKIVPRKTKVAYIPKNRWGEDTKYGNSEYIYCHYADWHPIDMKGLNDTYYKYIIWYEECISYEELHILINTHKNPHVCFEDMYTYNNNDELYYKGLPNLTR